ncbi:sugar ABC transporter ATP-binding protein [Conexibacter stalactiti]|uniref:Sugar ABC transporter ATP-binding protein n=1 Tax=Conexibacter stalactiti TaxID=1940611 RepID=A0ABU4HW19_9ACTN|nr:sugar ABC transporter ATP-binding protein [Conexibacter stalactiti]MDW5597418.1 sugar ABC transporter ATP-binding protein [Conexibacter stalactiti]MEC5038060.1 sugar ABC transporter ATP-binding protein [Conexibacter stalactiti]
MSIVIQGLTKAFGGARALDGVDLDVADGEIHALLGPNGSGKSTLIGCLSGRLKPDLGSMTIGTESVAHFSPREAFAAGTAVIYQHFTLVGSLSVADNVFLGAELRAAGGRIDRARQVSVTREILGRIGARLDPRTPVRSLSVGEKQLVEIAKALRHDPQLLVLDEPTAALSELEARALGQQLRGLRASGLAILYVTHLLSEVFQIADRVTVLRDGRAVLHREIADLAPRDVIAAIAPRGGVEVARRRAPHLADGPAAVSLSGFRAPGVGPIDLTVAQGECVGVFGLLGSGRTELLEGIYGIRGETAGEVALSGAPFRPRSASASLKQGLALVPAERGRQSVFAAMSALDNVLLPFFARIGRRWWRSRRRERRQFADTAALLALDPPSPAAPAATFSGGNQQKLAVGRWLTASSRAQMLLLDDPTQGIDVGARADLYALVRQFVREPGRGVLFSSSDPEEVMALADRALVLARGHVAGELRGDELSPQALLDLAHGHAGGDSAPPSLPTTDRGAQ